MFHDTELKLKVASKKDYLIAMSAACFLLVCAALVSPKPGWIIAVSAIALLISWLFQRQSGLGPGSKNNLFCINANGDLLLEERSKEVLVGSLSGTQWCSRYLAILRFKSAGRIGHLVIFKVRQCPEQFRQLSVWLRHNSHNEESGDHDLQR